MNKRIDLTNLGGFPLDEDVLDFMQQSYRSNLGAIATMVGNKVILPGGVVVDSGNVSDGWIVYNGEFIPFIGGPVAAKVVIQELATAAVFEDDNIYDVEFIKTASCALVGDFDFSELVRMDTLIATNQALTQLLYDFSVHTHSWDSITGKPLGYITYKGSYLVGDVVPASGSTYTISIPDQGTNNYVVAGSIRGLQTNPDLDDDLTFIVTALTNNSFKLVMRELTAVAQNVRFDYSIIKSS